MKILHLKKKEFQFFWTENSPNGGFILQAANSFESCCNFFYNSARKGKGIKTIETGKRHVSEEFIKSIFGLEYNSINLLERRFLWAVMIRHSNLAYLQSGT